MRNHRELLRYLLDYGQETFATDGRVWPMVHVIGDDADVVAAPVEGVVVADWMPGVVLGLVGAIRGGLAGFLAEAWMRREPSAEEVATFRRGDLQAREQQGDPTVTTVLIGGAASRLGSDFEIRQLQRQDDGTLRWEPVAPDLGHLQEGALVDGLRGAFAAGLRLGSVPDGLSVETAVAGVLRLTGSEGTVALRSR